MFLGKVMGSVVATYKYQGLEGIKLLLVQPIDGNYEPNGDPLVACDTVMAGPRDYVYMVGSREASMALDESFVPVDAAIVGIVDQVNS